MRVYFFIMYRNLEVLSYDLDIFSYFLKEEIRGKFFGLCFTFVFVELDDACIVEVADLLETSLEDVASHVTIYLSESFEFLHDLGADSANGEFIVGFVEEVAVDIAEGQNKQFFD